MAKLQPTPEQIKKIGKMSAAERRKRQAFIDDELSSIYCTLRKAKVHSASQDYRERRIETLKDEIERAKQVLAKKIKWLEREIKNIEQEAELLPQVIESNKTRAKQLEEERKLLRHGKQISELYEALTLAGVL